MHDQVTGGCPDHFAVTEAVASHPLLSGGGNEVEYSFDVEFVHGNPAVPQSSLAFFLQRLLQESNIAAIVIINAMSICFVGKEDNILFMDSHQHGNHGALFGYSNLASLESFLVNIKQLMSCNVNMCSITFVKFN